MLRALLIGASVGALIGLARWAIGRHARKMATAEKIDFLVQRGWDEDKARKHVEALERGIRGEAVVVLRGSDGLPPITVVGPVPEEVDNG